MSAAHVPGAALAVVEGDRIVHVKGYGDADPGGTPVGPQTPFVLGSLSKSFTAVAVMQLVERHAVELDAPVQRYLPWFATADRDASRRITIRQLLLQTSGLPERAGLAGLPMVTRARERSSAECGRSRASRSRVPSAAPSSTATATTTRWGSWSSR